MAASPYKTAVAMGLQEGLDLTSLNTGENGVPAAAAATKYTASVTVTDGVITATATSVAGDYTYILTPNADGTDWTVSGTCLAAGSCKS